MIPQQKMWSGCYGLYPPTQKRSEFDPWQSLSRDVLAYDVKKCNTNMTSMFIRMPMRKSLQNKNVQNKNVHDTIAGTIGKKSSN